MTPNGHPIATQPPCGSCVAAETNPYAGEFVTGCFPCQIRRLSQQPAAYRDAFYASLTDETYRAALKAAVGAEYRRRKALIEERGVH